MATNPFDSLPDINSTGKSSASGSIPATASTFGYNDPQDNGVGAWGDVTNDPNIHGVSLPVSVLRNKFGDENKAHGQLVKVTNPDTGDSIVAPIVDKGPAERLKDRIDLTYATNKAIGGTGLTPVQYSFVDSKNTANNSTSNPFDSLPDISESSNPFDKLPNDSSKAGTNLEQTGKVINLPAATPQELAKAGTQGYPSATPNQQPPKPSQLTSGLSAGIEGTIGLLSGLGAVAGGEAVGVPVTGGASLLAVPALFTAGSALGVVGAKKAEKLLGLEPEIQVSQQEYPKTAFAGQVIPQLPFAAESALGYGATALTKGAGAVAGQMAGQAAIGAGIMEPMRYGVDVTLNKAGITDQPAAPITFGSTGEQVLTALALGGKATGLAPSKDPIVNEKTAQVLNGAEAQTATSPETESKPINLPPATPEELAKAGETSTPVDNTQKLINLATDQLEHDEGSDKWNDYQKQIDALKQPAETPVAEAQPETPNAVQKQTTGEVGVRNAPAVGEGVGRQNEAEVPTQEGQVPKEEVKPTTPTIETNGEGELFKNDQLPFNLAGEVLPEESKRLTIGTEEEQQLPMGETPKPAEPEKPANPYRELEKKYYTNIKTHSELADEVEKVANKEKNKFLKESVQKFRDALSVGADMEPEVEKLLSDIERESNYHDEGVKISERGLAKGQYKKPQFFGGKHGDEIIRYLQINKILPKFAWEKEITDRGESLTGRGEYNGVPEIPRKHAETIYGTKGRGQKIDVALKGLHEDGKALDLHTPDDLWNYIKEASDSSIKEEEQTKKQNDAEKRIQEASERLRKLEGDPEKLADVMNQDLKDYFNARRGGYKGDAAFFEFPDAVKKAATDFGNAVYKAGMSFRDWSKTMIARLGEGVRDYLRQIWKTAKDYNEKLGQSGGIGRTPGIDEGELRRKAEAAKYGPKPPSERDVYAEKLTDQLTKVLGRPPTAEEVSGKVDKKFGKAETPAPAPIAGGEGEKISLKNESAEAEAKALGFPELTQQDEQEMNAAMDRAKATSTEDPMAGQRLAESLIADPRRSLTGDESALLLKHKTDLFNSLNKMADGLTEGSPEQKFEKSLSYDNASKAYHDLLQAIKDRGSEWGREGRWRQALLHQDYTFATQERLATAAKRKPLTSNEKTKLAEETKRLTDIDKQIAENQEKEANKQEQKGLEKELKNATEVDPYIQSLVDRVKKNVKSLADKYREELKKEAREGRLFTGVDPTKLHKFAVIGADHLLEGTTKFADWSSKMIGDFGEKIRPYLDDIFKKSKEFNEQQVDKESKGSKSVKKRIVKASSPEERIRKGQETRARNRLEQLKQEEERQNKGDFSKPLKKAPIEASEETKRLRIEAQKIKDRIDKRKADFEKANRPFVNKVLDAISALNRFNILSHITVLEHLAGAAVENIVTRPVSSTLAQLFRFNKTLNAIRNKAVYEGGLSAKSELKGVFGIATSAKDVWSKVLKGKADIDWLYGGKNNNSPSFVRAVENIHGAMKEPVRQGIFSRSLQLRIEAAEKQGLDPTHDEVLYHTLASEAVNDANSDIFMGDNFITRGIRGLIKGYETNKQSPRLGKFVSTLLDIAMPIMNVPTNIAIRKMRLALGLLEAPIRIGIAAKEGKLTNKAETLTTQEAEQIMRAFKYGTVGLAVGAYAWTHSNQFGGIINNVGPNAPENKDLKKGEMQLGGIKISRPLGHGPVATFMNMVADARRMYDKSVRNNPNNKWSSLSEPAFFSMFVSGLGSMPPAQAATRFFSPFTTAGQKLGQTVRDMIIPGAVQDVAAKMDTASQPKNFIDMLESEPIKRSPKTFEQEIMKGIPGLRNQLPTPKGRSSRSSSILPGFTESNNSTFGSFKD